MILLVLGCISFFLLTPLLWYALILLNILPGPHADFFKKPTLIDNSIKLDPLKNHSNHITRRNLPSGTFDHVIIGSGISGLTLARVLTHAGKRVCMLEAHDRLGGQMHVFRDTPTESAPQGAEFDVGVHYVMKMAQDSNYSRLEYFLSGTEWTEMNDCIDEIGIMQNDSIQSFKTTQDPKKRWNVFMNELKKLSPSTCGKDLFARTKIAYLEKKAGSTFQFLYIIKLLPETLINWLQCIPYGLSLITGFSDSWGTTESVLNEVRCSEAFKFLYCYCWGNIGSPPHQCSFKLQALLTRSISAGKNGFPIGGCVNLVNQYLHRIFSVKNSQAFTNARVSQIMLENSKVTGVTVKLTKSESHFIPCNSVISCIGIPPTFENLLSKQIDIKAHPQYQTAKKFHKTEYGCFIVFITLKKIENLPKMNYWVHSGTKLSEAYRKYLNVEVFDEESVDTPLIFASFPSAKDPEYHNADRYPNTSVCELVTFIPNRWLENMDYQSMEYEGVKAKLTNFLWENFLEYLTHSNPELSASLEDNMELLTGGTPQTMDTYINSTKGNMYGLAHTYDRFHSKNAVELRPHVSGISGLYLSGQDITTCGYSGGQMSGLMTAGVILGRNLLLDSMKNLPKAPFFDKKNK